MENNKKAIPCGRFCKDRSAECHATCEKYRKYAAWRAEERAKKLETWRSRACGEGLIANVKRKERRDKRDRTR